MAPCAASSQASVNDRRAPPAAWQRAQDHEWIKVEGKIGIIGITNHAQEQLGDVVFVDLPEVGSKVEKNETMGAVESVKAASDIYSPVSGKIIEVNKALNDEPALVNSSAEADGARPLLPLPLPPPPWPLPRGTPRCQACCRAHSRRPCAPNAAAGWMAKIELSDKSELDSLMDAAAYAKFCAA